LAQECTELSQAQVKDELKRRGIDVTRAVHAVREAMERKRARASLSAVATKRAGLLQRFQQQIGKSLEVGRAELQRLISERLTGHVQQAYFNRLESAASDEDLRSLLTDLAALDHLTLDPGSDDGEATKRDPLR